MKRLTEDKIQHIFRKSDSHEVELFVETFNSYSDKFGFTSDFHVNAFLAQIKEEIGLSLTPKRENLNYSCDALKHLFGYYERNHSAASIDGRCNGHRANQRNIANNAYGGRIGNHQAHDGWLFRGSGYIQLTGRANYHDVAVTITIATEHSMTADDLASEMNSIDGALLSAMAFFFTHKLYNATTIDEMTSLVNKHTPTYAERKRNYKYIASL